MRNRIIGILIILVVLVAGFFAYNALATPGGRPAPTPTALPKAATVSTVSAEGAIVPAQHTTLAFKVSGRVMEIPVREGDAVKSGAVLARLDDATLKAQVAQAQAALAVAQRQLAQLRAGGTAADRQAAKDAVTAAKAAYDKVKAGPTADDLAALKANLDNAQAARDQAQTRYDRAGGASNPFIGMTAEGLGLQQTTNAMIAAKSAYTSAFTHPTESELKAAASAVTQAESALARLDPSPEAIALVEAQIVQAQTALDLAKTAAQDAILTAPFDGAVAEITVNVGQVVAPGTAAFTFGNLAALQVETTDLAEVDVTKIAVGQTADVKVDALPNQVFKGKVLRISPVANDHRGDKVYKVTVALDNAAAPGLRWGMTANVDIAAVK